MLYLAGTKWIPFLSFFNKFRNEVVWPEALVKVYFANFVVTQRLRSALRLAKKLQAEQDKQAAQGRSVKFYIFKINLQKDLRVRRTEVSSE